MGSKFTFTLTTQRRLWVCLALMLGLTSSVLSACSKGCITCDTAKDQCLLCDPFQKFQLDAAGSCFQVTLADCLVTDPAEGNLHCLQCSDGMLFDLTEKKCVTVPSNKKVLDCNAYNQSGECVMCAANHYISNGKCLSAAIEVDGCLLFTEPNFCSVCEKDKRFDDDIGKCISFSSTSNCASHSFMTCDACLNGYIMEPNSLYSINAMSSTPNVNMLIFFNNDTSFKGNFRSKALSNCITSSFTNCATFTVTDGKVTGCATCGAGHYLEANNCVAYPSVQIMNCKLYSNVSTCHTCNETFFLDGNVCTALTTVTDCLVYTRDANSCSKCVDANYLVPAGASTCPARAVFPITNCEIHSSTADECTTCVTSFVKSDESKACLTAIPNCATYDPSPGTPTSLTCLTCETHFYNATNKLACTVQDLPNCYTHVLNENSCATCLTGYYLTGSTTKTCLKKNLTGCRAYLAGADNKCEFCNNLFSLTTGDGTCVALTDTNCARNTENTTTCVSCVRGFFLNGSSACVASVKTVDPLCQEVTDDGKCSVCVHSYLPFQLDSYLETLPSNCAAADSTSGNCTQCAANMDGADDSGNITCTAAASTTGKCLQLKATIKEALSDNDGNCAACRTPNEKYLSTNTCTDRTPYTMHNCLDLSINSDSCNTCVENTHRTNIPNQTAYCLTPPTAFTITLITECQIHDYYNAGKCLLCNKGFTITVGTPDTCTGIVGDAPHDLDLFYVDFSDSLYIKAGLPAGATAIANCARHYYSYKETALRCAECKATFTPVIGYINSSTDELYPFDPVNIFTSSYKNNIVECKNLTDADYMRHVTGTALTIAANCGAAFDLGVNFASTGNYLCLSCAAGKVGIVKSMEFTKDGGDASGWTITPSMPGRFGYAQCDTSADMSKSFKRLEYTNVSDLDKTGFGEIMFDTCSNSAHNVVHIRGKTTDYYHLGVEGPSGTEQVNSLCVQIPAIGKVDNCQVYTMPNAATASRDMALLDTYVCLMCKPGHVFKAGAQGTECIPIENCNLSGANTWMNACETCDSGYAWTINTSTAAPHFMNCLPNMDPTETFCMFSKSSNRECLLCKPGKTLNLTTKKCENYPTYCATQGFPTHNLNIISFDADKREKLLSVVNYFFADKVQTGPSICGTCANSKKMFMSTDSTDAGKKLCLANDITKDLVSGCKISKANSNNQCSVCNDEYVNINYSCVLREDSTNYQWCNFMSSVNVCTLCKEGYLPDSSGVCVNDHNCLTTSSEYASIGFCHKCKEGYYRHNTNKWMCVFEENDNTPCLSFVYSNTKSYCLKCRQCAQTPIRLTTTSTENMLYCVNNQPSYDLSMYKLHFNLDSTYHKGIYSTDLVPIPAGKYVKTTFVGASSMAEYACVRGPTDPHCTGFNANDKYRCISCQTGYVLNPSTARCDLGLKPGCLIYSGANCTTCNNTPSAATNWKSYYESGGNCSEHTVSNCAVFHPSSNECVTCKNGYNKSGLVCVANVLAVNCQESTSNVDTCVTCSNKFFRNNSSLCSPHTVQNCLTYHQTLDECVDCPVDFYKSSNNCLAFTAPNCKTKSTTANACTECNLATEYSNGVNGCVAQPAMTNCKLFLSFSAGCDECIDGFFESSGTCLANPSGISNCIVYTSATACTHCAAGFFLNSTTCDPVTTVIADCSLYSANGVCSACLPNKFLSATGDTCTTVNEASCLTWTDIDNCASCSGNNVLKTNTDSKVQCVASGLDHCLTPVAGDPKNTCSLCSNGFILRTGECFAPKISIANCREYDPETEKCLGCYSGNVLSADKTMCLNKIAEAGDFCARAHIKSSTDPTCNLCKFGYSQNTDGACEACGGEGCFMCDPSDLTKCKVCATEYYMTSSGTCSLNNPPEPESGTLVRLFSVMALMLLVLGKQ